jgi:Fe-S-cluster containining protein
VFVRVTGDDWTRLGDRAEELAVFIGHRAFMRMSDGHCAALEVRSGNVGAGDFHCAIYDRRPQICRDLARGSAECDGERETKSATVRHSACVTPNRGIK